MGGSPCNGWDHWYFESLTGELHPIDDLRRIILNKNQEPFAEKD
jgi:hypothetical protein